MNDLEQRAVKLFAEVNGWKYNGGADILKENCRPEQVKRWIETLEQLVTDAKRLNNVVSSELSKRALKRAIELLTGMKAKYKKVSY